MGINLALQQAIEIEFASMSDRAALLGSMDLTVEELSDYERAHVYACPGCLSWQVEYRSHLVRAGRYGSRWSASETDARRPIHPVALAHRRECPAFDMLAGLQGIPA